jgi:hypothetical protein
MTQTSYGLFMARMRKKFYPWIQPMVVGFSLWMLSCRAGNRSGFLGYLPFTGPSSLRIEADAEADDFMTLPPLVPEPIASVEELSPASWTVNQTNAIPEKIEKEYTVSSQIIQSPNTQTPVAVLAGPLVVDTGSQSYPLIDGFEDTLSDDGYLPPSGQASLRDLMPYFIGKTNASVQLNRPSSDAASASSEAYLPNPSNPPSGVTP